MVDNVVKAKSQRRQKLEPTSKVRSTRSHFEKDRFRDYDGLQIYVTRQSSEDQHTNLIIEIQVMSAFMWAWTTLENVIIYKKLQGKPDFKAS